MNRRDFLTTLLAALAGTSGAAATTTQRPRRILLRSSWQTVNIGDIAHTPGVLHLLEEQLPDVEVRLWPSKVDNGVAEMLKKRFPRLVIADTPELRKAAFAECDFLLHGSGPSLVAETDVAKWHRETGKPFGVFGITLNDAKSETFDLLGQARFVFFRDSVSLEQAKARGCACPVLAFGPDGAFSCDLRNDAAADAFLTANGLEPGRFLCCIPRLRYTPYWLIHPERPRDDKKAARNEAMKEHDHGPLRDAIAAVVRETSMKILLCPEDRSQMAVGREMIFDRLPDDVKKRVVWRENYWLTDEAVSTYVRSAGLFGLEMHSPILCIGHGIPALVGRFAEQTTKGFMWRDIGLDDWLFDFDQAADLKRYVPTVLSLAKDPAPARVRAETARNVVSEKQRAMTDELSRHVKGT